MNTPKHIGKTESGKDVYADTLKATITSGIILADKYTAFTAADHQDAMEILDCEGYEWAAAVHYGLIRTKKIQQMMFHAHNN